MKQEFKLSLCGELSTDWDVAQWEESGLQGSQIYWEEKNLLWLGIKFQAGAVQNANKSTDILRPSYIVHGSYKYGLGHDFCFPKST